MNDSDPKPAPRIAGSEPESDSPANSDPASLPFGAHVLADLGSLVDQLRRLALTGLDQFGLRVRRRIVMLLAGAVATLLGLIVLTSLWLSFLRGAAGGFAAVMGDRAWAGDLAAGSLGALLMLGAGIAAFRKYADSRRNRLRARYARRRHRSRRSAERFGKAVTRDVA